ncbi:MAG: hypothetical protein B7Z66_08340 [Chromatiales bacterium 21-64-14]|nr:MAG: hypothetical protein B7Z66_08340 [Chromatiales bacterium 21-64-14]HQU15344.1 hypothetical protein [Gammaproteobacteria bacterium]
MNARNGYGILRRAPIAFAAGLTLLGAVACAPVAVLHPDDAELGRALATLAPVTPVSARADFRLAEDSKTVTLPSEDAARRALQTADRMLAQAGPAALGRWFTPFGAGAPQVTIVAQVVEFDYRTHSAAGVSRPTFAVAVQIRALAGDGRVLVKGVYRSGPVQGSRYVSVLRGKGAYEDEFNRTAYRALLIALDRGLAQVSKHLVPDGIPLTD